MNEQAAREREELLKRLRELHEEIAQINQQKRAEETHLPIDADGKDYTSLIDQGTHYHSLDDLQNDLAASFSVSPSEITLIEE
jgi:hypothetical protein